MYLRRPPPPPAAFAGPGPLKEVGADFLAQTALTTPAAMPGSEATATRPALLLSQTLICPQPGRPGGLQGPHSTTLGSAEKPRSGARGQDGQGRVRGHGGPSAARSACSLHCAHLRGRKAERRELSVLSVG